RVIKLEGRQKVSSIAIVPHEENGDLEEELAESNVDETTIKVENDDDEITAKVEENDADI
ncbi:MAG: hypothetical protein GX816_04355, partial [Erysipelotrichia bacterium]|nr:hypothetical protein [Erysipelotrichia bacterium]